MPFIKRTTGFSRRVSRVDGGNIRFTAWSIATRALSVSERTWKPNFTGAANAGLEDFYDVNSVVTGPYE